MPAERTRDLAQHDSTDHTSNSMAGGTNTNNNNKKKHRFNDAFHHPIIHTLQHITSPLTAAMLIFGIHKSWQMPIVAATLRSAVLFARARSTIEFKQISMNRLP